MINFPFDKKEDTYKDGILQGMDVWDWVVTKDNQVRQIDHDDMQDLKGEDVSRFATMEEVQNAIQQWKIQECWLKPKRAGLTIKNRL